MIAFDNQGAAVESNYDRLSRWLNWIYEHILIDESDRHSTSTEGLEIAQAIITEMLAESRQKHAH